MSCYPPPNYAQLWFEAVIVLVIRCSHRRVQDLAGHPTQSGMVSLGGSTYISRNKSPGVIRTYKLCVHLLRAFAEQAGLTAHRITFQLVAAA